jgi:hypothetical protein
VELAFVAGFKVGCHVGIHAWPEVTLQQAFLCFIDHVMTNQQIPMGVGKCFWDKQGW